MTDDGNFDNIVRSVKRARAEAQSAANLKAMQEELERRQVKDTGVAALQEIVRPILNEARVALAKENITLAIEEDFGLAPMTDTPPKMVLQCKSAPFTNGLGGVTIPVSHKLHIVCDGKTVKWAAGHAYTNVPSEPEVAVEIGDALLKPRLNQALKACLESYYRDFDEAPR